jgi:hypothetical protein
VAEKDDGKEGFNWAFPFQILTKVQRFRPFCEKMISGLRNGCKENFKDTFINIFVVSLNRFVPRGGWASNVLQKVQRLPKSVPLKRTFRWFHRHWKSCKKLIQKSYMPKTFAYSNKSWKLKISCTFLNIPFFQRFLNYVLWIHITIIRRQFLYRSWLAFGKLWSHAQKKSQKTEKNLVVA